MPPDFYQNKVDILHHHMVMISEYAFIGWMVKTDDLPNQLSAQKEIR